MFVSADFWSGVGQQLRCPSGRRGQLMGRIMSLVNQQPIRLAIDALCVVQTDTVLELGFGPGRGVKALATLAPLGVVLGIDQSPEMLAQASWTNRRAIEQGRVQLRLGGFDALPFQSETIHKILAVNVIYFLRKTADEIREARRVLRPGGVMTIYATDKATMWRWKFSGPKTHSLFDEDELRTLVMRGGFGIDEVSISHIMLAFGVKGLLATLRKCP